MVIGFPNNMRGYTIIELMVTIVIVSVLAATVGTFVVKLLMFQEKDREEAYIREKLVDICGIYADFLSVGSSVSVETNLMTKPMSVTYRREVGGVSLETGTVSRVTSLDASLDASTGTVKLNVYGIEGTNIVERLFRTMNGNASLIPLSGNLVNCTITPLNGKGGALGNLSVSAQYQVRDEYGRLVTKFANAERIVRLWNHE